METQMKNPFEATVVNKILLCADLEAIRARMQNAVNEFKEKAPHRKDFIEHTEKAIETVLETELFIYSIFIEMETLRGVIHNQKLEYYKLDVVNKTLKEEVEKLTQTLNFDK